MNSLASQIPSPTKIHNARQQRELHVQWSNGDTHQLGCLQLRAACRCASCRARQVKGELVLFDQDLELTKVNNQGAGLQLVFSDGHERGIFPWQYLFELGRAAAN